MRGDQISYLLDERRVEGRWPVNPLPAATIKTEGGLPVSGREVAERYGLLVHYFDSRWQSTMRRAQRVGRDGIGVWLTPTAYYACMAPYDLGLQGPRDRCMLIDVSGLDELWGPARARFSEGHPELWPGGCIEFYCPKPIPYAAVRRIIALEPCGGGHPR